MEAAEASLQPALKFRQIVNVEKCSQSMKLDVDRMTYELNSVSVRKKCTLLQVISDFRMLRCMIGCDTNEFSVLFNLYLPCLKKEFPRTPVSCDDACVEVGMFRLSMEMIVFSNDDEMSSSDHIPVIKRLGGLHLRAFERHDEQMRVNCD